MFHGSIVALVTPMKNNQIDLARFEDLVVRHIDAGSHGIVVAGTTGESGTLSFAEKLALVQKALEISANRIPIIAGIACNATGEAIQQAKQMMELGVDGILVLTPYYIKPTQEGLFKHFSQIAQAVPLPIILYNVPSRTAVDLLPITVARLSEISNIVAIKEAKSDIERLYELQSLCQQRLAILSGDDISAAAWLTAGASGVISVTANVVPVEMAKLYEAAVDGDNAECMKIQQELMDLHQALFVETNPIPVKWAMHRLGWMSDEIRLPLTILSTSQQPSLEGVLKQMNLY